MPKAPKENEIGRMYSHSLKYKVILFTAYSAGLRVSEVAALKIKHIDSGRMEVLMKTPKAKKTAMLVKYVFESPLRAGQKLQHYECWTNIL